MTVDNAIVVEQPITPFAKKRDASVELLRCIAMLLICVYHCFRFGIFWTEQEQWWGSLFFTTLIAWHVDTFVAISGWFGIRFSFKKFLSLYWQILFYSVLSFCYCIVTGRPATFAVSGGWFGGTYLMLLMLAPLLNLTVERICERSRYEILLAWGLFAAAIFLHWIPRNLFTAVNPCGLDRGFSIVLFIFIYLTMRLIRLLDITIRPFGLIIAVVSFVGITLVIELAKIRMGYCGIPISHFLNELYWRFNAPQTLAVSIAMVVIFVKYVKIPGWIGNAACFISPSLFGIYLLHHVTSFGSKIYRVPETILASSTDCHPFFVILICAILTFVLCLCVDLLRRFVFFLLRKLFCSKLNGATAKGAV